MCALLQRFGALRVDHVRTRVRAHIRMTTGELDFEDDDEVVVVHDKVHVRLGESTSRSPHLTTFGTQPNQKSEKTLTTKIKNNFQVSLSTC